MGLPASYTVLAPLYDAFVGAPLRAARAQSLARLPRGRQQSVLLAGVGTGLDIPLLPAEHRYIGVDFTRAMLRRAERRAQMRDVTLLQADCLRLPFGDNSFDHAVLHLIVAVVADPAKCLSEAVRVTRPGGSLLLFDKFLRRGERAWLRKCLNPFASRIATRTDVVLEDVLERTRDILVVETQGVVLRGWFKLIRLTKTTDPIAQLSVERESPGTSSRSG
jgi:ubiquinone/menaquinone biosynthesis C-methylase UbiE